MRRLFTAAALLLIAPLAMAQAYKWTDANGTVHYSDNPPPAGTKFKRMNTASGTPTATDQPTPQPAQPAASTAKAPDAKPADNKPMADTPENRKQLCATLNENLTMLRSKQPLVQQQDGQQKLLDDAQRINQIALAEEQQKQYCSGK